MTPRKLVTMTAVVAATALLTAAPAAADDQMFADALDMIGVSVSDPVAVGRGVCASFDTGTPLPTMVNDLSAQHGISAEDAALIAGFSVAEYCDHHKSSLQAPAFS